MTWKEILKNSSMREIEKVQRVLDFVKNEMRPKFGRGLFIEQNELTDELASDILYLFYDGKSGPHTSQINDKRGNTELNLNISDTRFSFGILGVGNTRAENFYFGYEVRGDLYRNLKRDKVSPEEVENIIEDFLSMIGRKGLKHGLTAENLQKLLGE
tara:strand:- start:296 stop:766 length:471 start_codon:yes stop_codon:yes gene_type:complete